MTDRRRSTLAALQAQARRRQLGAADRRGQFTRREFLERLGAAGGALGLPPLLAACGGRDDDDDEAPAPQPTTENRTLFFNFAHVRNAGAMPHVLMAGGRRFPLTRVADDPSVLAGARAGNEFLRSVPDDQITHHVVGAVFATNRVTLAYVMSGADPSSGSWQMTSMYFNIPSTGVAEAYSRARARVPAGALPLSGKRHRYQLRAANSAQDLLDEHALVDPSSHAEALVGLHPAVLSMEPNSAAHIHHNIISADKPTQFLGEFILPSMGPAVPQGSADPSAPTPWAALVPMSDPKQPSAPWKMSDGKLNQYYPDWDPSLDGQVRPAMASVRPKVRDDETLGTDVTESSKLPPTAQVLAERSGKIWARHDGQTSFARSATPAQAGGSSLKYTASQPAVSPGLFTVLPADSDYTMLGDGRVQVKVNIAFNWFLRWLTMYVQFLNSNGQPIARSALPNDTVASQPGPYPTKFDPNDPNESVVFVDILSPAVTVLGIPIAPGSIASTISIPSDAQTLRVIYSSPYIFPNFPDELGDPGSDLRGADLASAMTIAFNLGLTSLFMALGAAPIEDPIVNLIVKQGAGLVAREVIALIGADAINGQGSLPGLATLMNFVKALLTLVASPILGAIVALITAQLGSAQIIDAVPVAGQIARAIAVVASAAELLETGLEVASSPPLYVFAITLKHDLSVRVLPDGNNTHFPDVPSGYTLYYKVTYMFDAIDAAPQVMNAVEVPDPSVTAIDVVLPGIPRGGMVNINIGFYARQSSTPEGQNDWCAGNGTTGLVDNKVDQAPDIRITQIPVPILPSTRYLHTRKTTLDAQARHVWTATATAPPYIPPPGGQGAGLGAFNGISVRQGRSLPPQQGYLGYAYKAFSDGLNGCKVSAPGQLDQLANLNTDFGSSGANAQNGYAIAACGQPAGVRVAYSLLSHDAKNCYFDSDKMHLRPIALDNPSFPDPRSAALSFGLLNAPPTRLLLHPQGHVVSINSEHNILEMLRLPAAAVPDADAEAKFRARPNSGLGSRPGLMNQPVAAAVSPEGVILVLEGSGGNNRIQSFDLAGNPVAYFGKQKRPYFLPLDQTAGVEYLDLAVEFSGYLYVLSKDASNNHRLDIYHPAQTGTQPICTTQGVNAPNLAVDFWRGVYTMNYEALTMPDGSLPMITEPSISLWLPTPPPT